MAQIKRRRTKDGRVRYQVLRYVLCEDGEYRQRSVGTFSTRKEAQRQKAEVEREGTPRNALGITVDSLLDQWIEAKAASAEPTTIHLYTTNAQTWRALRVDGKCWGELQVSRVRTEQVNRALTILGRTRKPQTVRNLRSLMKQAFDLAVSNRWLLVNPFQGSMPISSKQRKAEHWNPEEIDILRTTARARADDPRRSGKWARTDARIIELMVGSGMRREEALGLTRRHVDLTRGRARVQLVCVESYERAGKRGSHILLGGRLKDVPKTAAAHRVIPLPSFALDALRAQLRDIAEKRLAAGTGWNPNDLVFPDPETGGVTSPHSFSLRMLRLVREAGISTGPGSTHGLRHSHAQALLEHGQTSVPTVAQRLGHSSEKVTLMLYLRSTSEMDEAAAGAAEEVFGPQPARDAGRVETRKGRPPRG